MFKTPVVSDNNSFYTGDNIDVKSIQLSKKEANRLEVKDNNLFVKNSDVRIISKGTIFRKYTPSEYTDSHIYIPLVFDDVRVRAEVLRDMGSIGDTVLDKDRINNRIYIRVKLYTLIDEMPTIIPSRFHSVPDMYFLKKVGQGSNTGNRGFYISGFPVDNAYSARSARTDRHIGSSELNVNNEMIKNKLSFIFNSPDGVEKEYFVLTQETRRLPVTMYQYNPIRSDDDTLYRKEDIPADRNINSIVRREGYFEMRLDFARVDQTHNNPLYTYVEYDVIYVPN